MRAFFRLHKDRIKILAVIPLVPRQSQVSTSGVATAPY